MDAEKLTKAIDSLDALIELKAKAIETAKQLKKALEFERDKANGFTGTWSQWIYDRKPKPVRPVRRS
jgi:hypothetical protein